MELPTLSAVQPQVAQPQQQAALSTQPDLAAAFPQASAQGGKVGAAASGVQSEFGKQFARAYVESLLTEQFGFPVHIPDEEEAAYRRTMQAAQMANLVREEATDNASLAIRNALNLGPDVLKKNGLTVMGINADPAKFAAFANANKLAPKPLTAGDLFSIGVGTDAFAARLLPFDPEAQQAQAAAEQAAAQQKAVSEAMTMESKALSLEAERAQQPGKIAKADKDTAALVTEYVAGDGVYGPGKQAAVESAESAFGRDLSSGLVFGSDDDLDEPGGPETLLAAYNSEQKRVGARLGSPVAVATAFKKQFGDQLKDHIEDLPLDGQGNIVVGQPGTGLVDKVDAKATLGLTAVAMRLAKDLGKGSVKDLFLEWGLKASGVNPESFVDQLLTEAVAASPKDGLTEAAKRLQEYGLLEEFGPTLLARITQAAEGKAP